MKKRSHNNRPRRTGATTVEFALTAPILFLLVLGAFEFSRAYVLYHTCEIAAAEGARQGILPGASAADCESAAATELAIVGVRDYSIKISPAAITDDTTDVTVTASVPMNLTNGYLLPRFFVGGSLTRTVTLPREMTN